MFGKDLFILAVDYGEGGVGHLWGYPLEKVKNLSENGSSSPQNRRKGDFQQKAAQIATMKELNHGVVLPR